MRLTADNSNTRIVRALMRLDLRFYDPKTQKVFNASPCASCGTMTAHGNEVTIDRIDNALHRALIDYYSVIDFVEVLGFDDDGEEFCEHCE